MWCKIFKNPCIGRLVLFNNAHLSTAVARREKKSKHFVFNKYFCLVLGVLKSKISKKSFEPLLRKSDFKFAAKTPMDGRLRFQASIVILSISANIRADIIYIGTLSGLSGLQLGLEGSWVHGIMFLFFFLALGESETEKNTNQKWKKWIMKK